MVQRRFHMGIKSVRYWKCNTTTYFANGSATFAGNVKLLTVLKAGMLSCCCQGGNTSTSTAQTQVFNAGQVGVQQNAFNGRATFAGNVTAPNVTFNLEADDDTKYTATTSEDGEQTLVYNGAVLDVKERLQKTDAALAALKSAAAAAVDFAALKSAIATALADI